MKVNRKLAFYVRPSFVFYAFAQLCIWHMHEAVNNSGIYGCASSEVSATPT